MAFEAVCQFFHKSLTEHTLTLAVDKDDFRAGMAQILLHHLGEAVDLEVEDIGRRESGGGIKQLRCVKVDHYRRCGRLRGLRHRRMGPLRLRCGLSLDFLFDYCLRVALDAVVDIDIEGDDRALEVRIGTEAVELGEFGGIDPELHIARKFAFESTVALVGYIFESQTVETGEIGLLERESVFLDIGLYHTVVAESPLVFILAAGHNSGKDVVIRIVDDICVESGLRQRLDFRGLEA